MKKILLLSIVVLFLGNLNAQELVILHTNDMHSRITGYGPVNAYTPEVANNDKTLGGFARLASLINQEKKQDSDKLLVLDAGDFLMGTMFHPLEPETGFQLQMMKELGYDATTLGNHEFDFGADALAQMIISANKGNGTPTIIAPFIEFSNLSGDDKLQQLYKDKKIKPYKIIERNGLKIGIFSILGYDAQADVKFAAPLKFEDPVETAQKYTKILREQEKVDIVIALSHSGIYPDGKGGYTGEDMEFAKKVPDIDIIISGHTHVPTPKYIKVGKTIIVQTGSYLHNLGRLSIVFKDGKLSVKNFKLIPIDDKIKGDEKINAEVDSFENRINKELLNPLNLAYNTPIAEVDYNMYLATHEHPVPSPLGNLVSDAVKYYVNKYSSGTDIVLTAGGVIRENIFAGTQTPPDAFRVMSLGFGKKDYLGYPLVKIYLTAKEVKKLMELTIFTNDPGSDKFLYYSGLKVDYNPSGFFLHKVKKIELNGKELDFSKKNKKLYTLTTDSYIISFIGSIKQMSHGLIKVYPKNQKGEIISDFSQYYLDFDKNKTGVQEGKQWIALIDFWKTFKDTDGNGIPNFPEKYKKYNDTFISTK